MKDSKWETIMTIGKPYSLEILESLFTGPKRYSDLNKACPIEKTRAKRLKELKSEGLIQTTVREKAGRDFVHYKLTEKGQEVLRRAKEF